MFALTLLSVLAASELVICFLAPPQFWRWVLLKQMNFLFLTALPSTLPSSSRSPWTSPLVLIILLPPLFLFLLTSLFFFWLLWRLFSLCSSSNWGSPTPNFVVASIYLLDFHSHVLTYSAITTYQRLTSPYLWEPWRTLARPTSHIPSFLQTFPGHILDSTAPNWIQSFYLTPNCLISFFSHFCQQLNYSCYLMG